MPPESGAASPDPFAPSVSTPRRRLRPVDKAMAAGCLSAALQLQGLAVGRQRARALMRSNGLRARWRRKFVHTTDSRHTLPVAANVLTFPSCCVGSLEWLLQVASYCQSTGAFRLG